MHFLLRQILLNGIKEKIYVTDLSIFLWDKRTKKSDIWNIILHVHTPPYQIQ